MIILIETAQGANFYIARSYVNALSVAGHQVIFWDNSQRSCFDIFYEIEQLGKIDIFFGHSWRLDRTIVRNLLARPYIKIIMRANIWGDIQIDTKQFPVGIADDNEKKLMEELSKHPGFNHVTCQGSEKQTQLYHTHNKWENLGLTPHGILLCADLTDYFYTKPNEIYKNDIVYAGSYWPYKSKYLSWFYGLCYPNTPFSVKIFGNNWSTPSCVGLASEYTLRNLYSSSLICPNLFESHSVSEYSDINQRTYQTSICGGFQLCQRVKGIEEIFPNNEIILFDNQKDFYDKIVYYIKNPSERIPYIKGAVEHIYKYHTNFHRSAQILNLLGYEEQSQQCLNIAEQKYNEVKNEINE